MQLGFRGSSVVVVGVVVTVVVGVVVTVVVVTVVEVVGVVGEGVP